MIALEIFWEWLASFIETMLYFFILNSIAENQFTGKKQIKYFFVVATIIAAGVVLLNIVEVTISLPTVLYAIVSIALGACILYRGKFIEFLFVSTGYVTFTVVFDIVCISILRYFGMNDFIAEIASGFSIRRMYYVAAVKFIQTGIVFLFCMLLRKSSALLRMSRLYMVTVVCLVLGCIDWTIQTGSLIGIKLNLFQIILGISCVLGVCVMYFLLRVQTVQREKEYAAQQNKILERNYQMAKQSYEANAKLYHDMRNHFVLLQLYLADGLPFFCVKISENIRD